LSACYKGIQEFENLNKFDLQNVPLSGINLIEASAGTGKTYAITGLFLRLILENEMLVDQILVVTFTNAATSELKEKIRNILLQAKEAFINGSSKDSFIDYMVKTTNTKDNLVYPFYLERGNVP